MPEAPDSGARAASFWEYTLGRETPMYANSTGVSGRGDSVAAVGYLIEALRERIDTGARNNARHVQALGWAEILAGITAFAVHLARVSRLPADAFERHTRLVVARRSLPPAQAAALQALAQAVFAPVSSAALTGTHPHALGLPVADAVMEQQLRSDELTDQQRGDNLFWLLVVVADTAREQRGVPAVPRKTPDRPAVAAGAPRVVAARSVPSKQGARGSVNGFAVASLVLGLLGGSLLAVIFGHVAHRQLRRDGGAGATMATVGLVLGYLGIVAAIVLTIALASATH